MCGQQSILQQLYLAQRQYNAGYQADVTRSAGQWEAGNMRAQGQRTAQLASIQAALTSQVAATQGAATTQRMIIQAAAGFQTSQVSADVARNIRDTNIGASLAIGNIVAGAKRDLYMNAGNTSAAKIDQGVSLVNAMIPPEVPVAKGLVEIPKYDAITKRNRTANYATTEFSAETVQNQETTANRIVYSAQRYQDEPGNRQAVRRMLLMGSPRPRPERLAEKLLQIRESLGLSQSEMLKRLGKEVEPALWTNL